MKAHLAARIIYRHIRTIDTFSDVAIQLEHDAEKTRQKAKALVLRNSAMEVWKLVSNSQHSLDEMPQELVKRILDQRDACQYERYLGGQWLRERSPRTFNRHSRFFSLAQAA